MTSRAQLWVPAAGCAAAMFLGGCGQGAGVASGARITAPQYADAFQAARDALRDARLTLDRVDATQGVLTTRPTAEPGAAKPWSAAWGARAASEDLFQRQQRTVHVAFAPDAAADGPTPADAPPPRGIIPPTDPARDLLQSPTDTTMRVRVLVQRVQRPGRRVSSESVRLVTLSANPAQEQAGLEPAYLVDAGDDQEMAAAILRDILERIAAARQTAETTTTGAPAPASSPASPPSP